MVGRRGSGGGKGRRMEGKEIGPDEVRKHPSMKEQML